MPTDAALVITTVVTALGWYTTYAYARLRDDRTRRLDLRLKWRARQLEELYGPLLSLIEQIFNVWRVRESVLHGTTEVDEGRRRVKEFFWIHYFSPLHQEIGALLRTKLYLLEAGQLPASFTAYLEHATQETCQHRLASELGVDTSSVPGRLWPQAFHADVKAAVGRLMQDYRAELSHLE